MARTCSQCKTEFPNSKFSRAQLRKAELARCKTCVGPSTRGRTKKAGNSKLTVAYWHIRGLAAPLRMMCYYANATFEDKTYKVTGTPGDWDRSAWFDVKPALVEKNGLMNLPYIIDGDLVLTQSNACLGYLGRKFGLCGANELEITRNEQARDQCMDLRNGFVGLCYSPKDAFQDRVTSYLEGTNTHFQKLEQFMTQNGTAYVSADKPLYADFHIFEMLDVHKRLAESQKATSWLASGKYPKLSALYQAMTSDPKLAGYFSSHAASYDINNTMASFK